MRVRLSRLRFRASGVGIGYLAAMISAALVLLSAGSVAGAIIGLDAFVSTSVQELIDGQAASISTDEGQFDSDAMNFPIQAVSGLVSTGLDGRVSSVGRGVSELADPTQTRGSNPAEFGLEVACFSNSESVSYSASSSGREFRTVVFSSSPQVDPLPIDFDDDGTRVIESEVFLSGAMLIWSIDPLTPLDEMIGELHLAITHSDENDPLLEAALLIDNLSFDNPELVSVGPIQYEVGGVDLLTVGADAETKGALEDLEEVADVLVVLVPFQSHKYEYIATADQEFLLGAEFTARVRNVPGGTGVAAAWGREFESLGDLIAQALPEVDGSLVQKAINAQIAAGDAEPAPEPTAAARRSAPLCGALGLEFALIPAMLALTGPVRNRRSG